MSSPTSTATGSSGFWNLKIRGRLMAGFGAICLVLAAAVGYTVTQVGTVSTATDRMVNLRVPVAQTSTELVANLYSTLATLRGYLLTGNPQGKADRAAMWQELGQNSATFDRLAARFTDPANREKWQQIKLTLAEFRAAQDRAETIAFTADAFPATKVLLEEAAPRAEAMTRAITAMIDDEDKQEATAARKSLLKTMADVRGNLGLAVAGIRAFLLSGDAAFKDGFNARWTVVQRAFASLGEQKSLLTPAQANAYETFAKALAEFGPLPARMFEIRESARWNVPVHILVTEAAPRAGKILDILDGPKGSDGTRSGGLKDAQQQLLATDAGKVLGDIGFLQTALWVLLGIGLALAGAIALLTARAIVNPIAGMTGAMQKLAGGDKTVEIPAKTRTDEIGTMAAAVQVFKDNMIEAERLRGEQEAMKKRAEAEQRAAMHKLADEFEASVKGVVQTVASSSTQLQSTAQSMSATAEETSRQATAVAAASEQASTNVQTVASAAEELSSSIAEISRQVSESTKIAGSAAEEASRTNVQIKGLAEAAQKIGDVVKLISDIAAQTNLLALNATIEAARAGEAGKGFAVVASEVKSLATQTAKATEEISAKVAEMQTATGQSVQAIDGITGTIGRINEIATTIAAAVEEQGAATQEIARNVQQASAGTTEVSSNIGGVTQAASETGAAATQVLSASGELSKQSETLGSQVDAFIARIRAA
ncbi:MAG: HAMP domain-containing protein [Alphaproteobacteria bacterium]|nr:HAMP domain-containing protein [Alphaproteobacteria bacterium]